MGKAHGKWTMGITTHQGNQLFKLISGIKQWWEKIGDPKAGGKDFTFQVRTRLNKGVRRLWNRLAAVSPILQERGIAWYGQTKDAMREIIPTEEQLAQGAPTESQWTIVRPNTVTQVDLSEDERYTLFWLLYAAFHADGKLEVPLSVQAALWELVEQLGSSAVSEMERELGLNNVNDLPLKLDEEPVAAAQE